jgi:hypothetical protein
MKMILKTDTMRGAVYNAGTHFTIVKIKEVPDGSEYFFNNCEKYHGKYVAVRNEYVEPVPQDLRGRESNDVLVHSHDVAAHFE